MANKIIDARGAACPGPITDLVKAYRNAKVGDVLELWSTDKGVRADTEAWAKKTGNKIVSVTEDSEKISVVINILKR